MLLCRPFPSGYTGDCLRVNSQIAMQEWNARENRLALTQRTALRTIGSSEGRVMSALSATDARARLYRLIDEAAETHEPILITGKRSNAVLLSEDDWRSIQETLFLLSVPGMRESIVEGMKTPVEMCSEKPGW